MSDDIRAFRASILHCLADPGEATASDAVEYLEDGVLVVEGGRIATLGPAAEILPAVKNHMEVTDYRPRLLVPGFIDCHVHYPQIGMVASWGEQLLEWLERYTYPAERRFAEREVAERVAEDFVDLMLAHGTTSALIFPTVHPVSVDAIFGAARARRLRISAGKVLMDRHCPADLRDTAQSGYAESRALIERWHGQDRLGYAITPRFAITSTAEQLALAGRLAEEFPDVLVHTHLAENRREVERVAELFPEATSYLDVYRSAGLLRERAVFAHCLHLEEPDYGHLASAGAAIAFCPGSNLFMGSGLFDLARARGHGIPVGLATDVGAGTSLSLPVTAGEAYKVLELRGQRLTPWQALYLMTLGAARALGWDDVIGSFEPGKEADFVILDATATPLARRRLAATVLPAESLFALTMLGDDRSVVATYVLGERVWQNPR
ncbi:MAG: guanine deaminase [Gammaproteobacteria bacterium]